MALQSLIETRRAESRTPEGIAARAAKANAEAGAKAIEMAAQAIHVEPSEQVIEIRLDGSAFKVR
jgi:hypothetical protein